jgi:hypothetical protein
MKTLLIAAALLLFTRELVQSNSGEGGLSLEPFLG